MGFLAPLAALLGIEVDALLARLRQSAVTYAVLALLATICVVFLLVAAQLGLSYLVGPLWAALIIAGVALLLAVGIWLWANAAEKARQRRVVEKRRTSDTTALITTAAITALPMLIRNPALRVAAVPIGAALGYLFLSRRDPEAGKKKT